MSNTYDDDDYEAARRRRKARREERIRRERIRRRQILCVSACVLVLAIIIVGNIIGGDDGGKDKSTASTTQYVNANANGNNVEEQTTQEALQDYESTEPVSEGRYDNYGDDLYNDGKFIVCIDPGHGGNDNGCIGIDGSEEKDDALTLAKYLKYQLEQRGITVVITRTTDVWVDLLDRPKFANENNADLLISLHRNAYEGDSSVKGFEAWINSYDSDNSEEIANMIMENLEEVGISNNRGVKRGTMDDSDDYRVNARSSMPSVLLEMGFMSSPTDNWLYSEKVADYAIAIADAINSWYQDKPY